MDAKFLSAVITADVVNYTGLPIKDQQKLMDALSQLAKPNKLEFYRGDSFQVYLKHPNEALRLLVKMRTAARSINAEFPMTDIRASIGIGEVNHPLKALGTASGEAFILSGRSFDNMFQTEQKLVIQSEQPQMQTTLRLIASFIDYLMNQLTSKQAEVVFELLNNQTQLEAAKKLKKSQATVNQHLQSAAWSEIEKLLGEFERLNFTIQ
jgi:hypothetical protein